MNSDLPATGTVALLELLDPFVPVRGEFPSGVAATVLALEDDAAQPV